MVREATIADKGSISKIYNYYVENIIVTFEVNPVEPAEMGSRIESVISSSLPWIVFEDEGFINGQIRYFG